MISDTSFLIFAFILSLKLSINLFYVLELNLVFFLDSIKYNKLVTRFNKTIKFSVLLLIVYLLSFFLFLIYSIITDRAYVNIVYGIFISVLLFFLILYAIINPLLVENIKLKRTRLGRKIYFESSSKKELFLFKFLRFLHALSNILFLPIFLLLILN